MNASRRFYPRLRSIILEVSNKMHSFRGAFCRFCREKRHADGFGAFNFATLVFLLLARHSPQAVSARAACVGCHQKYRESRDDVAGVLYLFSAKRYPKTPRRMPLPTLSRLTFETGAYSRVCKQTGPVSRAFSPHSVDGSGVLSEFYFESIVETRSVISSSTSSSTFTVSSAVKTVTLFSTAVRRIS